MKLNISLLCALISFSALASEPPYDRNCVELGKRWGWIKGFDASDASKRTYATPAVIQAGFRANQTRQSAQLAIWEDIDKHVPCLKDNAGFSFQNGRFVIFNMQKFTTFRLGGSRIDCQVTARMTNTNSHIRAFREEQSRRFEAEQSGRAMVRDNTRMVNVEQRIAGTAMMVDATEAQRKADEMMARIRQNNNLGDLGLENYCTHQLRAGITLDKSQTAQANLAACDGARRSNNTSILNSSRCEGYPARNQKALKDLRAEMDAVQRERSNTTSQPLVTINNADNDVYSQFRNNYTRLVAAQDLARRSMSIEYASNNLLRNSGAMQNLSEVANCGDRDVTDESYLSGLQCNNSFRSITDLTVQFQPNIDVLKDMHRDKLITEMNVRAFGEAIKSKWYLLDRSDPLKTKMKQNPKAACLEIADASVCSGKYLEAFKSAVNEAWNYSKPHFLSYTPTDVASFMNSRIEWMREFCENYELSQQNQLIRIAPAAFRTFEDTFNEMVSGAVSPYLYDEDVRAMAKLETFRSLDGQYCQGFNPNDRSRIDSQHIVNARDDFKDAIEDQIDLSQDFAKPDRGNHSNNLGAMICDTDRATKEDHYALNSLYESHPLIAGQIIGSQGDVQAKLFATSICEAKDCNKDLEDTNDTALKAAKISAIALNLVPGVGPALYAGTSAVLGSAAAIRDTVRANQELSSMQRGIASNGVEPIYDQNVGVVLEQLASDGNVGALVLEIAAIAATEYAGYSLTHKIMHPLEHAIHARGIHLTKLQHDFIDILVHKAVMKAGSITTGTIKDAILSMTGEKISPPQVGTQLPAGH